MSSAEIWAQHARYALEKAREEVAAAKREVKRGGPGAAYRLVQAQRDLRALTTKRRNPRDPFAGVRRAIEKEVARFVAEGPSGFNKRGRTTWGRLMDSAYAVYEKYRVESDGAVLLPVETVTAEIQAAEERARVLRREHNEKEMREAEREYRYQQFQRDRERGYR